MNILKICSPLSFKAHFINVDIGASSINGSLKIHALDENNRSIAKERLTVFSDNEKRNEDKFERNVAQKIAEFEQRHKEEIAKYDKGDEIYLTVCYPGPGNKVDDKKSGFLLSNFFYDNSRRERFKRTINPFTIDNKLKKLGLDIKQSRHANDMAGAGACLLSKIQEQCPEILKEGEEILYMYPGGGLGTGMIIVDNDNIKIKPTEVQHTIKNRHFKESVEQDVRAASLRENFGKELRLSLEDIVKVIGDNTKMVTDYNECKKGFRANGLKLSKEEYAEAAEEAISKYMDSLAQVIATKICDSKTHTIVLTGPIINGIRKAVNTNEYFESNKKMRLKNSEEEIFTRVLKKKIKNNLSDVGILLMGDSDKLNFVFLEISDNTDGAQLLQKGKGVGNPANWYNIYQ